MIIPLKIMSRLDACGLILFCIEKQKKTMKPVVRVCYWIALLHSGWVVHSIIWRERKYTKRVKKTNASETRLLYSWRVRNFNCFFWNGPWVSRWWWCYCCCFYCCCNYEKNASRQIWMFSTDVQRGHCLKIIPFFVKFDDDRQKWRKINRKLTKKNYEN